MTKATTLFVQGAGEGAYEEDRLLADYVRGLSDNPSDVAYPKIDGLERLDWPSTKMQLQAALTNLADGARIVAHSLGGAAILKLLSDGAEAPRLSGLYLVATPYKCRDGEWGTDDFALDNDFAERLPECGTIRLYHSRDDEFVPAEHVRRYGEKIAGAKVAVLDGYGHQFSCKPFTELDCDLRG